MTNFAPKSGAARASPAALLLTALKKAVVTGQLDGMISNT